MRWTRDLLLAALAALGSCGLIDLSPFSVSTWPSQYNQVLSSAGSVWVGFSEPVQQDAVQPFFSVVAGGQTLAGDYSWTGNRLVFTPVKAFAPGVRHVLQLQGTVQTVAGRSFSELVVVPFYVGTDSASPIIASVTPSTGGVVGSHAPLTLTFSQAVDAASFGDAFSVNPVTGFTVSWDVSSTVATITPASRWSAGSLYTWSVAAACRSQAGVAVERTWTGTFLVQSDATSPGVASVVPATLTGGGVLPQGTSLSDLLFGECIRLTFTEDIDLASLETAFSLSPSVAGTVRKVSPCVFVFVPSDNWTMGQEYLLAISTDLEDLAGNPLPAPYREVFTPSIPAQSVTAVDAEGSLTGTLPLAAPLNGAAPLLLPWVNSGTVPDSELILKVTIHFAQPYAPEFQPSIAGALRCTGYFPATTISPQILNVSWIGGQMLIISYVGFHRSPISPSLERLYYKLTIPGGQDQTRNQSGSFMKDPITVLLESGSDS